MPKIGYGVNAENMLSGLDSLKAAKLEEINRKCDEALNVLTATYPTAELLTFDQQKEEAKAFAADGKDEMCPLLKPIAEARGIELSDLCNRVLVKSAAFSAASGAIIGKRQALEDQLDKAATSEEVAAIAVVFELAM